MTEDERLFVVKDPNGVSRTIRYWDEASGVGSGGSARASSARWYYREDQDGITRDAGPVGHAEMLPDSLPLGRVEARIAADYLSRFTWRAAQAG